MAVANGYDDMETQKRTMEAKLSAAAAEVNALRREHDRVIDKCTDLEIKMNQYSKLSMLETLLNVDELEASIDEINATTHRYSAYPKAAVSGQSSSGGSGVGSLNNTGGAEGKGTGRPGSPSQVAMVAAYMQRQGSRGSNREAEEEEEEMQPESVQVLTLVEEKFKAFERLVFALKKRVLIFESNDELLATVQKYGSVAGMLERQRRLQEDNDKLRLREQRFHLDPLLRRRVCRPSDSNAVLPVLLMALQNELAAAQAVIAQRRFPARDTQVRVREEPVKEMHEAEAFITVEEMLQGPGEVEEERGKEEGDGAVLHPQTEYELMQRLNSLEYAKSTLLLKIERMREERALQLHYLHTTNQVADVSMESGGEEGRLVAKEKKVARLTRLNESLMAQIGGWEDAIQAKEETVEALNEVIATLTQQKIKLTEETLQATDRSVRLRTALQDANRRLGVQARRVASLYAFAQALALSSVRPDDLPPHQHPHWVGFLFRDVLRAQARMAVAALRVQKVLRGHAGRNRFKTLARPHRLPLPLAWDDATGARRKHRRRSNGGAQQQARLGGPGGDVLGYLGPLCKVMVALPLAVEKLATTKALVHIAALQTRHKFRAPIAHELNNFGEFLRESAQRIAEAFAHVLPETKSKGLQAGPPLASVPHLIPRSHVERARGPWVGAWAQPPAYVRKQVPTQVFVQTPAEEEWEEVDQPEWERPGLAFA